VRGHQERCTPAATYKSVTRVLQECNKRGAHQQQPRFGELVGLVGLVRLVGLVGLAGLVRLVGLSRVCRGSNFSRVSMVDRVAVPHYRG
jgi:hypothetical protein